MSLIQNRKNAIACCTEKSVNSKQLHFHYMSLLLTIDIFNMKRNVWSCSMEHSEKRNGLYRVWSFSSSRLLAMINWSDVEHFLGFSSPSWKLIPRLLIKRNRFLVFAILLLNVSASVKSATSEAVWFLIDRQWLPEIQVSIKKIIFLNNRHLSVIIVEDLSTSFFPSYLPFV